MPASTPSAHAAGPAIWPDLPAGSELTIIKVSPEGEHVTTYPGWVVDANAPEPWIAARADWVRKVVEMDGLQFIPGDTLHEFFSPEHSYNVFSVWSPEGTLRGWYANVTHPTTIDFGSSPPTLYWHDLYVDLIALPDGRSAVRDEDELLEAGVAISDPALHAMIEQTRDELIALFERRDFPFHER